MIILKIEMQDDDYKVLTQSQRDELNILTTFIKETTESWGPKKMVVERIV